jgi:hypothetical protein
MKRNEVGGMGVIGDREVWGWFVLYCTVLYKKRL